MNKRVFTAATLATMMLSSTATTAENNLSSSDLNLIGQYQKADRSDDKYIKNMAKRHAKNSRNIKKSVSMPARIDDALLVSASRLHLKQNAKSEPTTKPSSPVAKPAPYSIAKGKVSPQAKAHKARVSAKKRRVLAERKKAYRNAKVRKHHKTLANRRRFEKLALLKALKQRLKRADIRKVAHAPRITRNTRLSSDITLMRTSFNKPGRKGYFTTPKKSKPKALPKHTSITKKFKRKLRVTATAYTSHVGQTDSTPNIAAWGDRLKPGDKIIAVSRDLLNHYGLKHNTEVKIAGLDGTYLVQDKMNKRWRKKIDIYMGMDRRKAMRWGRKKVMLHW